jgi:thiamine-phosphate pyrophosphorylase
VTPRSWPRLYAILDVDLTRSHNHRPLEVLDIWLDAGVRWIQLRAKSTPTGAWLDLADQMRPRVHAAGATLVINDRVDIASLAGADGVHLGQDDLAPSDARTLLGSEATVGLSTHTDAQLTAACREPISYLAVGPVFSTMTKVTGYASVGLAGVGRAVQAAGAVGLPVVAIGGITLADAPRVIAAGAAAVAIISDLFVGDLGDRAAAYLAALGA